MAHDFKVGDQYEIKSYKTNHVAMHKGAALMIPQEEVILIFRIQRIVWREKPKSDRYGGHLKED
jgi:hypothetical protein